MSAGPRDDRPEPYQEWLAARHEAMGVPVGPLVARVEAVTGGRVRAGSVRRVVSGHSSAVFTMPLHGGLELVVRAKPLADGADPPAYESERWARSACRSVGVPTPRILHVGVVEAGGRPLSLCVEEKAQGVSLWELYRRQGVDDPASRALTRQAGAVLAAMHRVRPDGFGTLDAAGRGRHDCLRAHLCDVVDSVERRLADSGQRSVDVGAVAAAAALVRAAAPRLEPARPSLLHRDFGPDHLFAAGGRVSAVIDLEAVEGGNPASDVAWWDYWRSWGLPWPAVDELVGGYAPDDLLRADTLAERIVLHRLETGLTTLDYWVANRRPDEARRAGELLRDDLARLG